MKIRSNKIIFLIFLIMTMITNINASVGSCNNGKKVTLKETSEAAPANINAHMPVCQLKLTKFVTLENRPGVNPTDANNVAASRKFWIKKAQDSVDNKSIVMQGVQVCNDPNAYLTATSTCKFVVKSLDPIDNFCLEPTTTYEPVEDIICEKQCKKNTSTTPINPSKPKPTKPTKPTPSYFDQSGLIENPNVENMKANCNCNSACECTYQKEVKGCNKEVDNYCEEGEYNEVTEKCEVVKEYKFSKTKIKIDSSKINTVTSGEVETKCERETGYDCTCDSVNYAITCPVYGCQKINPNIGLCTPNFEAPNGNAVYCVNPGQPFSNQSYETAVYEAKEDYIIDESFNVKECESSYSTVDCGYANILIEGKKHSLDKKTIELALRLWGVHTNQAGFNYIGVSNATGSSCSKYVIFMKDGHDGFTGDYVNPYVKTYWKFRKELLNLENIRNNDYIDPTGDLSLFSLACNKNRDNLGVACGESNTYKQAFALLANTILGNDKMQEHLSELFKNEISEDIDSVNLINDTKGNQYIEIHFKELTKVLPSSKEKIDCNKLDQMVREKKITKLQKSQIEPYCKVEASIVDGNGKELKKYGGGVPEYCYKDYCRVKTKKFAICDVEKIEKTPIKVKATYNKSNSSKSINKYISCSNPIDNQILMGFDDELFKNYNSDDPRKIPGTTRKSQEYIITNYKCAGSCNNYSLRGEIKERCSDDTNNYNKTYNSSIKDPSLKCILNMSSSNYKNMYDYTNYFGVNSNVCKIYCSDEVEYYIADKVKSKSGSIFYYDIEQSVNSDKNIKYLFSNIIKEKRTCVSEINYNNESVNNIDWKKIYDLGNGRDGITQSEINGIKNWRTLFKVMVKKAENENGRTENLNKLLYDLYNCNLYSESEIKANGIKKPKNDKVGNIKDNIIKKFSRENNYGISTDNGCRITDTSNNCITMKDVTYEFGAAPSGKSATMKSVTTNSNTLDKLVYCSGPNCFAYNDEAKDKEYDYPTSTTSKMEEIEITGSGLEFDGKLKTKIKVPTNDYVMFEATTQVSFYNSSLFEVKPSGDVILSGTNTTRDKFMKLQSFAYPINKDAYNLPVCSSRTFLNGLNRCEVTQQYDNVETYERNIVNDNFSSKIKLSNKFKCYVDVTPPTTVPAGNHDEYDMRNSTIFKNVDVSNIFPSSSDGFTTNKKSNWATDIGKKATLEITNSSNDLITTENYLEYRITLSPSQINSIKEYNKENESYINEEKLKCQIVGDTYQNCQSPFMNELRSANQYGTIDSNYSNGKPK